MLHAKWRDREREREISRLQGVWCAGGIDCLRPRSQGGGEKHAGVANSLCQKKKRERGRRGHHMYVLIL